MKELSIEEKAKCYDEAKARMSIAYNSNRCTIGFMNEIFPELKESEDGRIRKAIIEGLREMKSSFHTISSIKIDDAIAWLEKQGNLISALQEANKKIGELVEENYYLKEEQKGKIILSPEAYERVLKLGKKQDEQKPAWSEEDERFLNVAINILNSSKIYTKSPDKYEDTINWFKSLKDRVQPQNTWKPSDEQMEALRYVTNFDYGGHKAMLVSLYEQLKKLKG